MKLLILLSTFCFSISAFAQQSSAQLAADLQSADPAHWPAIEALLKSQRAELVAAHEAALAAAAADFKAARQTQSAALAAAKTERDAAKTALAAKTQRIQEVLGSRLKAEQKQNAALNLSDGPRSKLLRELITEAETPEKVLKRQALEAEIAAKKKELDAMK